MTPADVLQTLTNAFAYGTCLGLVVLTLAELRN